MCVPRRTNLFQRVVLTIHEHVAEGATVEESAMLPSVSTGELREVDVVIHASAGPYPFLIGIEATARKRPADTPWVEQMIAKHDDLPTSKLVLVCEAGFTANARCRAGMAQIVVLTPEELDTADPQQGVLARLVTLWPKFVTLKAEKAQLLLRDADGKTRVVRDLGLDTAICGESGEPTITLGELVVASAEQGHLLPLVEDLRRLDHDAQLAFFARGDQPPQIRRDGVERSLYFQDGDRPAEWTVEKTQIEGLAVIEIGEIPLTHRRLGEIAFAYGTGRVGDQNLMAVLNDGKLTIRPAPSSAS